MRYRASIFTSLVIATSIFAGGYPADAFPGFYTDPETAHEQQARRERHQAVMDKIVGRGAAANGQPAMIPAHSSPMLHPGQIPQPSPIPKPGRSSHPSLDPDTLPSNEPVEYGPYQADLDRRIKRAWFPPKGAASQRVTVRFRIGREGLQSQLRLVKSSGLALADQAALQAVERASPFRPLPVGSKDVNVETQFAYNLFPKSGVFSTVLKGE